jgi:hypothetical protein
VKGDDNASVREGSDRTQLCFENTSYKGGLNGAGSALAFLVRQHSRHSAVDVHKHLTQTDLGCIKPAREVATSTVAIRAALQHVLCM